MLRVLRLRLPGLIVRSYSARAALDVSKNWTTVWQPRCPWEYQGLESPAFPGTNPRPKWSFKAWRGFLASAIPSLQVVDDIVDGAEDVGGAVVDGASSVVTSGTGLVGDALSDAYNAAADKVRQFWGKSLHQELEGLQAYEI